MIDAFREQVADAPVQLAVSDNASTDGTPELLARSQAAWPRLRWARSSANLGPDRNYLRAVEIADAEHCWLFGSDDIPVRAAVDRVLEELDRTNADVLLVGRLWCSYDMQPLRRDGLFEPDTGTVFDTSSADGLRSYLERASSICALFSYLSSIVVRKSRWDDVGPVDAFVGSAYAHSAKLLGVLTAGARVAYLPGPLVLCRGDNDYFLEHGAFNRCRLDFVGYTRLIDAYLGKEPLNGLARGVIRREYTLTRLLLIVSIASSAECRELQRFLCEFRYSGWSRTVVGIVSWAPVRALWRVLAPSARRLWWWRQRRGLRSNVGSTFGPS